MEKAPLIEKTFVSDKKFITLRYPNVRYAKENHMLVKKHGITSEMIAYNMELCGFEVLSLGEFKGAKTNITVCCCNINCNGIDKRVYATFITQERLPLCEICKSTIKSINVSNKRPIAAIKGAERVEFESIAEAANTLNISSQNVYNHVRNGKQHSSGYSFEFLD